MLSVKKVKNRSAAFSPWSAMAAGRVKPLPVVKVPEGESLPRTCCGGRARALGIVHTFRRLRLAGLGREMLEDAVAVGVIGSGRPVPGVRASGTAAVDDANISQVHVGRAVEWLASEDDIHRDSCDCMGAAVWRCIIPSIQPLRWPAH